MKEYNKANIPLAKTLRKNMTLWERKLWYEFLRYYPLRFQRQKAIGNYIADFYCRKANLVIEIDGAQHYTPDSIAYDRTRTEYFKSCGIEVVRFLNRDINQNFENVCTYIDKKVKSMMG